MKIIKTKLLFIVFTMLLMSCIDEIVPPATEAEIVEEISRTWTGDMLEDGQPYGFGFTSAISANPSNQSGILISNFHNSGGTVTAVIYKDLTIDIPQQTIGTQIFKGSGEISNDYSNITWDYTIVNSGGTVHVTGTYTYGSAV